MPSFVRPLRAALWVAVCLFGASLVQAGALDGAAKLGFGTDPAAALRQAAEGHRPLFVFFTTDWCSWCRRLEADVLSTPEFQAGSAHWVRLLVDAEKGEGVEWAKRFHVSGFPTLVLLDEKGVEIDRQGGYSPMPGFLKTFQDYEKGVGTLAALQREREQRPDDQALALQVAAKLADRGDSEGAKAIWQAVLDKDPRNERGGADEAAGELAMLEFRATKDATRLEAALRDWKGLDQGPQLYNVLISLAAKAGDETRMRSLLDRAIEDHPDNADLLNSYAWTCAEKGWNLEKALDVAGRAVELSGRDPGVLDTLAEVQFRLGHVEEARALIDEALRARPGDPYLEGQRKRFQDHATD